MEENLKSFEGYRKAIGQQIVNYLPTVLLLLGYFLEPLRSWAQKGFLGYVLRNIRQPVSHSRVFQLNVNWSSEDTHFLNHQAAVTVIVRNSAGGPFWLSIERLLHSFSSIVRLMQAQEFGKRHPKAVVLSTYLSKKQQTSKKLSANKYQKARMICHSFSWCD